MKQEETQPFNEVISTEAADLLYEVGQKIKKEFKEPQLGDMIINISCNYRTGVLQMQFKQMLELVESLSEQVLENMEEQEYEDIMDKARKLGAFDNIKIQ